METIRGKVSVDLDINQLKERLAGYQRVILDLGTGDGRYVRCLAERDPGCFVIGVDSCRENLREHSRAKFPNILFVIASAQDLPHELNGAVSHININFLWGSLLESLLNNDPKLMCRLEVISGSTTSFDIYLNGGAMAEACTTLKAGANRIYNNLLNAGWQIDEPISMDACALYSFPSTWAKRLACGRDARAIQMSGWII